MRPLRATRRRRRYQRLIHQLNQRCRAEFDRAEALRAELMDIRASIAWRFLEALRRLKRRFFTWINGCHGFGTPNPCEPRGASARVRSTEPVAPELSLDGSPRHPIGSVSIIIPFRDQPELLRGCLASLRRSSYRRFEIVLVDNASEQKATRALLDQLRAKRRHRITAAPGPFNFARLCNTGARLARGSYLLFLNNDTQVQTPDWLEQMLSVADRPEVGVVGATLLYPDGTIQHAGLTCTNGVWQHTHRGCPLEQTGELAQVRAVPAVTGACLLISRDLFDQLGGFDERLPITHNDVDLCRRVRARGLLVAITPHARLLHYESLSRGYTREQDAA